MTDVISSLGEQPPLPLDFGSAPVDPGWLLNEFIPGIHQPTKGEEKFQTAVLRVYDAAQQLLLKKHQDYGPKNISESPGGPLNGLRVRMWDKIARLNNLIDSGAEPENESLRDTLVDILNYAAIGLLVLDGDWPA